ncbi:MAG: DUF433 domain-containing protein [Chloroflexota bacterium]|nr:MAG: antitoxin [Chloroflexota bacterium]
MAAERCLYQERIIQDPEIMTGKPVIKGTRIPVELVLGHLAYNPDLNELFGAYPQLSREDVQASLAYAQSVVKAGNKRATRKEGPPAPAAPR